MRRTILILLSISIPAALGTAWFLRKPIMRSVHTVSEHTPTPDAAQYASLKQTLTQSREELALRYRNARTKKDKQTIVGEARQLLESQMPVMMRCWLGTPWDFHGTAREPGQGKIACGYFVTTVLQDAGFQVERVKLAQQASEVILRSMLPGEKLTRRVGVSYESFAEEMAHATPGIYIVGLDSHVGFVVVRDGTFRFLHSSGQMPWCVVDETRENANTLQRSRYRVFGSVTGNDDLLTRWLQQQPIPVATR